MVAEEKATNVEVVMEVAKEEAARSILQYKASAEFEDEVREAICNALFKDFEECKKKI